MERYRYRTNKKALDFYRFHRTLTKIGYKEMGERVDERSVIYEMELAEFMNKMMHNVLIMSISKCFRS